MPNRKSANGRSRNSEPTASLGGGDSHKSVNPPAANSRFQNNKSAPPKPKPPTGPSPNRVISTHSPRGPPSFQSHAAANRPPNVSKSRPISTGPPNPPAANSRPHVSVPSPHSHNRSLNQTPAKATGNGPTKVQGRSPIAQAPPANSPSKQPPPHAGKFTSPVATFSQPIPGGRTSANILKQPSNPRASVGSQSNSTGGHGNRGEHKVFQHQSIGQAPVNYKENKQAHPQKIQGHTSTQQTPPTSQARKQQPPNQERSPPPSRPAGNNLTAKGADRPSSAGMFSSFFGRTQVESASPAKIPKNPPHVSQNMNKGPSYSHPLQETSQKYNNGQKGATHMHQKDNRSARRTDVLSSVESMPQAMKTLPVHQTELKATKDQVTNTKAAADRSPHVLGPKPAPSHSPAVNGGSSHPSSSTHQKISARQNMTSGSPDAKRLPTPPQSTDIANSKHFDSHKATPVPKSINVKSSSDPQATKKESLYWNQAATNATKSQAAVARTGSPGIMSKIPSFFRWGTESKPSVTVRATDKRVPATNQRTSTFKKDSRERPLPEPLIKAPSPGPPKSHNVQTQVSNLFESKPLGPSTNEPRLSSERAKNMSPIVETRSAKLVNAIHSRERPMPELQTPAYQASRVSKGPSAEPPKPRNMQTQASNSLGSKPCTPPMKEQLSLGKAKNVTPVVETRSAKPVTANSSGEIGWSQWAMQLFTKKDATPPKAEPVANHEDSTSTAQIRSRRILSSGTSHMVTKSGTTTSQRKPAPDSTTNISGEPSERQPVQHPLVSEVNQVTPVQPSKVVARSNPSKAFSGPSKESFARQHKDLLRQHSRALVWRDTDQPRTLSALTSETAAPLPSVPKNELQNKVARRTIAKNPDLFKITTPIKVDRFEKALEDHPNRPFVNSVVRGLRKGFWPYADTSDPNLPTTFDSPQPALSQEKAEFIRQKRDEEVELGRWSESFGTKLKPGMYASPIRAVPKSKPGAFRLIVDQSQGPHSLNSMIPRSQVKVKLDDIHDLGTTLIAVRKKHGPKKKLTVFKSDVKGAYRLMPMHPLWQIRQVATVDGERYVDRCNTFGNRAGGWIWDSFISLVLWIGKEKKGLDMLGYVDDDFSWDFEKNTMFYKPYNKDLPVKQARYLQLWDELGIPHEEDKQLYGPSLPIIGLDVDPNAMRVSIPAEKKAKVISLIRGVAHEGKTCTLEQLQSVAGSINSVLSLYPHLRPRMRALFDEMATKDGARTKIQVNKPIARKLQRLADYLEDVEGIPIGEK